MGQRFKHLVGHWLSGQGRCIELVDWTRIMFVCCIFCQFMLMRKFVYCVCDCACDLEICVHTVRDILRYFILCFIREYV